MPCNKKTPAIPEKIRKEYHLTSLLSLHENAIVFSVEKKKSSSKKQAYMMHSNPAQGVIKVMPKSYFDEDLFSTLQSLHHPLLLLPTELIAEEEYVYALYPRLLPLSEYLLRGEMPFSKLVQWIKDMSQIIPCLQDKHIVHGDISPGNIYLDDEGHFYLGDFSSGRLVSFRQRITALIKNKSKTAATFPFASSSGDYRQDIFSFLTILLKILEACSPSDYNATLSPLQDIVVNLLTDLEKKKSFSLTFREVCQKILSVIEKDKIEQNMISQDFALSPDKLDFVMDATKPLKKKSKISVPVMALAFCCLIFLSAIIYYGRTGMPRPAPKADFTISATHVASRQDDSILDISDKKYQDIASSSNRDASVKIIFAQGNQIKKLSSFSIYPALEELYLDDNMISDLSNLSEFKHLAILGLSNNQVTDLSTLKDIPSLKILDLSGQKNLSGLSSLGNLENLEYLILTETNATNDDIRYLQQSLPDCMILH